MRFLFFFTVFSAISTSIYGQTIHVRIVNDDDATPLPDVAVENLNSNNYHVISDSEGHYAITANSGEIH
jgi:hypothetical protein